MVSHLRRLEPNLRHLSINGGKVGTSVIELVARGFQKLTKLHIASAPAAFVPLMIKNKSLLTSLQVGCVSNQGVHIICQNLSCKCLHNEYSIAKTFFLPETHVNMGASRGATSSPPPHPVAAI